MVQDDNKTIHVGTPQTYVSPRIRTLALENRCAILASSKDPTGFSTKNFNSGSWDGESTNAFGLNNFESGTWK